MSVPENARTKGKLEACVKAHDLACYTLQITTNKKNFPEQFQAALTDKIVSAALDIHTLAWSANNVLVNSPEDLAGLHFELNEKKTRIYPLCDGIDFLGFRYFLTDAGKVLLLIRPDNVKRERKKLRRLVAKSKRGEIPREKVDDSYSAWRNHAGKGNTFRLLCRMDQYYINLWR